MSNNLLTISYITNEGLDVLENDLTLTGNSFNRQYDNKFAVDGAKIGATANIRRPPRYQGTFGPPLNVEDTNETYTPVTLNYQFHVDVQFTTADLLLSMDLFRTRVLAPMMATVANRVDSDGWYFAYQNIPNMVGIPGVPATSFLNFALADAQLSNEACPAGPRMCTLGPIPMAYAVDGVKGLFNPQAQIGQYIRKNMIAKDFANLDWYKDQNVGSFTTGAQGGNPVLSANTGGAFLTTGWADSGFIETSGWSNSTGVVKVGDIIQIAGVYPANPQSRTQYGTALKQFVVLPPGGYTAQPTGTASPGLAFAPATLTSGTFNATTGVYSSGPSTGPLSIRIAECVITGGQFQNAVTTAAFTSSSALTVNGGTAYASTVMTRGMVLHKSALALASADLPLPRGVQEAARASDNDIGLSIRMVTQYTINNDAMPTRADILYGFGPLYRQLGVQVAG